MREEVNRVGRNELEVQFELSSTCNSEIISPENHWRISHLNLYDGLGYAKALKHQRPEGNHVEKLGS